MAFHLLPLNDVRRKLYIYIPIHQALWVTLKKATSEYSPHAIPGGNESTKIVLKAWPFSRIKGPNKPVPNSVADVELT